MSIESEISWSLNLDKVLKSILNANRALTYATEKFLKQYQKIPKIP